MPDYYGSLSMTQTSAARRHRGHTLMAFDGNEPPADFVQPLLHLVGINLSVAATSVLQTPGQVIEPSPVLTEPLPTMLTVTVTSATGSCPLLLQAAVKAAASRQVNGKSFALLMCQTVPIRYVAPKTRRARRVLPHQARFANVSTITNPTA